MTDHPGVTGKKYITTKQLRERWGNCSHMTIERKLEKDETFPKPYFLTRVRMWDLADIEEYERNAARIGTRAAKNRA